MSRFTRIKQAITNVWGNSLVLMKRLSLTDFMLLGGAGLLFYGIYAIYPPASYIFSGLFLIIWAVVIEYGSRGKE